MSERANDVMRRVSMELGFTESTPGSVLVSFGRTRVLCTASVEEDVPRWMRNSGKGWVTAEYGMLPGSSSDRIRRDHISGGRAKEISRLIGRALRAGVDFKVMGEAMVRVDCDVIEADGGTRTAAITGACVALMLASNWMLHEGLVERSLLRQRVAAVSVGIVDGVACLDLDYREDSSAQVDMNVVATGEGRLIEVQGTGEGATFSVAELHALTDLAFRGIAELAKIQRATPPS